MEPSIVEWAVTSELDRQHLGENKTNKNVLELLVIRSLRTSVFFSFFHASSLCPSHGKHEEAVVSRKKHNRGDELNPNTI